MRAVKPPLVNSALFTSKAKQTIDVAGRATPGAAPIRRATAEAKPRPPQRPSAEADPPGTARARSSQNRFQPQPQNHQGFKQNGVAQQQAPQAADLQASLPWLQQAPCLPFMPHLPQLQAQSQWPFGQHMQGGALPAWGNQLMQTPYWPLWGGAASTPQGPPMSGRGDCSATAGFTPHSQLAMMQVRFHRQVAAECTASGVM